MTSQPYCDLWFFSSLFYIKFRDEYFFRCDFVLVIFLYNFQCFKLYLNNELLGVSLKSLRYAYINSISLRNRILVHNKIGLNMHQCNFIFSNINFNTTSHRSHKGASLKLFFLPISLRDICKEWHDLFSKLYLSECLSYIITFYSNLLYCI